MQIEIICTIGPACMEYKIIKSLESEGATIFRINGAHGTLESISRTIARLKKYRKKAGLLLDLPGNKIRVSGLKKPIKLKAGAEFFLHNQQTNFSSFFSTINKKDIIYANDSKLKFECIDLSDKGARFLSHASGLLENNKGLHGCNLNHGMPFLFERDKELLKIGARENLEYIGLSFVRNADDILTAKDQMKSLNFFPKVISKTETSSSVRNINAIIRENDYFLIDRGDLSSEIGIEKIPEVQDMLISKIGKNKDKKIFLATQFLHSMVSNPFPLIAEINDLYHTLLKHIDGIQLSEEVSIGRYPVECVKLVRRMAEVYTKSKRR